MADLKELVAAELENLEQVLAALPPAGGLSGLSVLELAGAATLLSSFYNGVENILKQALKARAIVLPTGEAWHRDLLQLACQHAIIRPATRDALASYLAFRHFITHAYGFDLDPERIQPLLEKVRQIFDELKTDLNPLIR